MKAFSLRLFIFVFCIFLFSFGSRNLSLEFKGDENFYFESAKEMLERGDVLTPRYMGRERFQKPILFYWLVLLSFKVFGVNWFAARLPSIICGALCALLVFGISNLFSKDRRTGLFAALFFATTPLCYRYARLAVPDMTMVFLITLALYYFIKFYKDRGDSKEAMLFFAAMAFAVLVKGAVGLIIPLLIVGIFCLIKREKKLFRPVIVLAGIFIFTVIAAPWFYLIYSVHGDAYLSHVWGRELLQRLGRGYTGLFIVRYFKGLFFYAGALITKFLPYSLFLPLAFVNNGQLSFRSSDRKEGGESEAHNFLILWVTVVFFFFTFIAEKRSHYLLVLWPAASVLIGAVFKKAVSDRHLFSKIGFKIPYAVTALGVIFFAALFIISDFISGKGGILTWKYALLVIPVLLVSGFRFRASSFMPLSLILSLALLYIAMTISPPLGLFMNKMERAASVIRREFKEGDRIGIGSHGIIPEELQAYFEIPVENVKAMYRRDGTPNFESAQSLLHFLESDNRFFCVIKRRDYETFIPNDKKRDLYVMGRYYVWKRRIRLEEELKKASSKAYPGAVRKIFQNEIYIISNKSK